MGAGSGAAKNLLIRLQQEPSHLGEKLNILDLGWEPLPFPGLPDPCSYVEAHGVRRARKGLSVCLLGCIPVRCSGVTLRRMALRATSRTGRLIRQRRSTPYVAQFEQAAARPGLPQGQP